MGRTVYFRVVPPAGHSGIDGAMPGGGIHDRGRARARAAAGLGNAPAAAVEKGLLLHSAKGAADLAGGDYRSIYIPGAARSREWAGHAAGGAQRSADARIGGD